VLNQKQIQTFIYKELMDKKMNFNNIDETTKAGFTGFKKKSEFFIDSPSIQKITGSCHRQQKELTDL